MGKKRTCETCEKINSYTGRCKVLTENIKGECWAWSDETNWEVEALEALNKYLRARGHDIDEYYREGQL